MLPALPGLQRAWGVRRRTYARTGGPPQSRASTSYGPEPPSSGAARSKRVRKPEWVRILEEDADNDPDVARLLEGTEGDPDRIREKMRYALKEGDMQREGQGSEVPPRVSFRAISPMGLWLWLEFVEAPMAGEQELLEGVLKSWFAVGKLGGFNSQNLQVYQNADDDQSFFEYDNDDLGAGQQRMMSYVHEMGDIEYQGNWARVMIDMGTADELAIDVLINTLLGFSAEMAGLKSITLGGQNEDWPLPADARTGFMGADADYMKVGMNPMKLPEGLDEEFQFMDDEGMLEGGKGRRPPGADGGSGGYGITAGPYGATADERELQELAARLRRPPPAAAPAGGAAGRTRGGGGASAGGSRSKNPGPGYYGAREALGPDADDMDINPDEFEFTDEGDDTEGPDVAGGGGGGAEGTEGGAAGRRPWGLSFVRRVKRDAAGRKIG